MKAEPTKVEEALQDESWVEAMHDELLQFQRNDVWTLVPRPKGKHIIGTKWIFRNKTDEEGNVICNKAWLVAQGYSQMERVDYDETFTPVARMESIKILLALEFYYNMHGIDRSVPLFFTRIQGTRIPVASQLVADVLQVPKIEFLDYPSCDHLRTISKDEIMATFVSALLTRVFATSFCSKVESLASQLFLWIEINSKFIYIVHIESKAIYQILNMLSMLVSLGGGKVLASGLGSVYV
nr:uncharacterized protein LOC112004609 [Quercus suber]